MSDKKVTPEAPYSFRELTADDVFPMFKIIGKLGADSVKEIFSSIDVKRFSTEEGTAADLDAIGYEVAVSAVATLMTNLGNCKKEVYEFIASVASISVKELRSLKIAAFAELVIQLFTQPDFMDFFKVVLKLVK